jgi:hypothetical protein
VKIDEGCDAAEEAALPEARVPPRRRRRLARGDERNAAFQLRHQMLGAVASLIASSLLSCSAVLNAWTDGPGRSFLYFIIADTALVLCLSIQMHHERNSQGFKGA